MDFTAAILKLLEKSSIGNLIPILGMYLNQMVPLMASFVHKRTCCHKLYAKNGEKLTNFEKNALCDISTIFKIALRGVMLLQNYVFCYYFISTD